MHWKHDIEVLTPLFNRGAYQDTPELRVPSIRGMVRWWFRQLEYQALTGNEESDRPKLAEIRDMEKSAFGGVHIEAMTTTDETIASPLVFRVSHFRAHLANPKPSTLPHDPEKPSPQAAFAPGALFHLEVFTRFGDLNPSLESKVERALEVWLLLGALGLRANRSGGNVWPANGVAPATAAALRARLNELGCRWPVMLAGIEAGSTIDQLRAAATDTVDGMPTVFGQVRERRIASKVKFKVVRLDGDLRLLITAPDDCTIAAAREALLHKPQPARSKPQTWRPI